jgi:hypothetical protein
MIAMIVNVTVNNTVIPISVNEYASANDARA